MAKPQTNSLRAWAFKSHRIGMLVTGIGAGFIICVTGISYEAAAKALGESVAVMGNQAQAVAQSVQIITGPVQQLGTIGGYLSYKIFGSILLLVSIYAIIQGAQLIRGSETKGIFDVWFAAGRSRSDILRDRLIGFGIALAIIMIFVYLGTVLGGIATKQQFVASAIGQCCALALVAILSFFISFTLSQFLTSPRAAEGITSAFLVVTYFVANLSSSLGALTFLRYVCPSYYYLQDRTLVPGHSVNIPALVALIAAILLCAVVGILSYLKRDIDDVVLRHIDQTPTKSATFHHSVVWQKSLWLSWIAEQPISLMSWFLGIAAFTSLEASVAPDVKKLLASDAKTKHLIAANGVFHTESTFVSYVIVIASLLAVGFIVSQVSRWVNDVSDHRVDMILSQPVSNARFIIERVINLLALCIWVSLAAVVGVTVGALIGHYGVSGTGVLRSGGDLAILCFGVGGIGLLLTGVMKNGLATGLTGALLITCFFLTLITGLFHWPSWTNHPSVFAAFGTPYLDSLNIGNLVYLLALGVMGSIGAYLVMRFRERVAL